MFRVTSYKNKGGIVGLCFYYVLLDNPFLTLKLKKTNNERQKNCRHADRFFAIFCLRRQVHLQKYWFNQYVTDKKCNSNRNSFANS